MVWVRADSSWSGLGDLRGARVGIGAYATTALLFLRGLLEDEHGIRPADVTWLRTRPERRPLAVSGVVIQDVKTDLDTLLRTRAVDAIAAFESPADAAAPRPGARRLVRDESAVTADYRRRTGIFPIMHVIALRASIHDRDRSIASRLVDAFERARARGDPGSPPYGVSPNRATLDAALRYARRQYALELPGDVADMFIRT